MLPIPPDVIMAVAEVVVTVVLLHVQEFAQDVQRLVMLPTVIILAIIHAIRHVEALAIEHAPEAVIPAADNVISISISL